MTGLPQSGLGGSADTDASLRITSDEVPLSGVHIEDYALIERRGRFVLFKKGSNSQAIRFVLACRHQRRVRITVKKAAQKHGKRRLMARSVENRA